MLTAPGIILTLKIAVIAVSLLLVGSLTALARGNYRLHGRINIVFFVLTELALLGLEVVARLIDPTLFRDYFDQVDAWTPLKIHLAFSIPSALILPVLLITGLTHRGWFHYRLALVFLVFWVGTFITGVFFLPHRA